MEHARRAVELNPSIPQSHFILGVVLEAAGRPDQAADQYRQTLQLDPQHRLAQSRLAAIQQTQPAPNP